MRARVLIVAVLLVPALGFPAEQSFDRIAARARDAGRWDEAVAERRAAEPGAIGVREIML